jgi:hypothetical protein
MASTTTAAETARVIVDAMVIDLGLRPDEVAHIQALKAKTRSRGVNDSDLAAGLDHAGNKENWVTNASSPNFVRLTAAGFAAAAQPPPIQQAAAVNLADTTSYGQSGGITAQIVNFHGAPPPSASEKKPWWKTWLARFVTLTVILAGIIPLLEYLGIKPWWHGEQRHSVDPAAITQPALKPSDLSHQKESPSRPEADAGSSVIDTISSSTAKPKESKLAKQRSAPPAPKSPRRENGQRSSIGNDNTLVGVKPPLSLGSGNTIIGPTDVKGNTILNKGGTAIGKDACADSTGVAVGAGAQAGNCTKDAH